MLTTNRFRAHLLCSVLRPTAHEVPCTALQLPDTAQAAGNQ